MISVSLKNILFFLSFMAQSGFLSARDEQISGPNGIQPRQLCYARVALGEAEGEEELRPCAASGAGQRAGPGLCISGGYWKFQGTALD